MTKNNATGIVGGIQKFSMEDGPGIRTTVFLKGCPLNCRWCHNPELIGSEIQLMRCPNNCISCRACEQVCPKSAISFDAGEFMINWNVCDQCMKCTEVCWSKALNAAGQWMTVEEVMSQVMQDKDFYLNTGGGMTISGGELLSQPQFSEALMNACADQNIGVVLDTSGYGSYETLHRLASHKSCTHILFDLKIIEKEAHRTFTGVSNEVILHNLKALAADPAVSPKIIIRLPLISGVNDLETDIQKVCGLLADSGLKSVTLLPYHELGVAKCRNIGGEPIIFRAPDNGSISMICDRFRDAGIYVEVLGEQ